MEFTKKPNLRLLSNKQSKALVYDAPARNNINKGGTKYDVRTN